MITLKEVFNSKRSEVRVCMHVHVCVVGDMD